MSRYQGSLLKSKVSDDSDKAPDRSFSKWDKFLSTPEYNRNSSNLRTETPNKLTVGIIDEKSYKSLHGASLSDSTCGAAQLNTTIVGVDGQGLVDTPLLEDMNVESCRQDLKNPKSLEFNFYPSTSGIESTKGISMGFSENVSSKTFDSTTYPRKERVKLNAISSSDMLSTRRHGRTCFNISDDKSDPLDQENNLKNILTERERNLLYHNVDLDDTTSQYFSTEAPCTSKSACLINTQLPRQKPTTSSDDKPLNTFSTFERSQFPTNGAFQSIDLSIDNVILKDESGLDISELEETYLSLSIGVSYVGAACYNVSSTILELVPDMMDKKLSNIIEQLMRETGATKLLFSRIVQNKVESILQTIEDMTGCKTSAALIPLSSSDFRYETSRRRLFNISLPCYNQLSSQMEREFYISSKISETDKNMVRAAGALLKYLENMRIGIELENTALSVPILDVKVLSLSDTMYIDDFSLKALQIFSQISHPSGFKLGYHNSKREGVSLYGLLNCCRSRVGSFCLRTWLMKPLKKKSMLEERLDAVEYFSHPRNIELTATLKTHLAKTGFLKTILSKMKQSEMTHGEWATLCKTVFACMSIGDLCKDRIDDAPIFRRMVDMCGESLYRVGSWLHRIVDLEETSAQKRFVVKFGIEPELDEKKRTYGRLPEILSNVASSEMSRLQDHITECGCIYLPQIGYLFTTPATIEDEADPVMKDLGFDFCFTSNGLGHYKNAVTRNLDKTLGDTECEIRDIERTIMSSLQESVSEFSNILIDVVDTAAELDCLIALAHAAREYGYMRPILSEDRGIRIIQGRHPLQEMYCSPFVANDTEIDDNNDKRVSMLTGPNGCGKSIYLKQIAMIVFMAQIGCFVPAHGASIGLVDAIYTRLRTCESVALNQSAFMIDLNQVSAAVNMSTERSLVIIDNFGKGTDRRDGNALLTAILEHFMELGSLCPFVVATVSEPKIILHDLGDAKSHLNCLTFDFREHDENLVQLYQLMEGVYCGFHALDIAKSAGISNNIISRAREIKAAFTEGKTLKKLGDSDPVPFDWKVKVVNDFLKLDLQNDDVVGFVESVWENTAKFDEENPLPSNCETFDVRNMYEQSSNNIN